MKKILAVIIAITFLLGNINVATAAERENVIRYSDDYVYYGEQVETKMTDFGVATMEDGKPVAVLCIKGREGMNVHVIDINAEKILRIITLPATTMMGMNHGVVASNYDVYFTFGRFLGVYSPATKTAQIVATVPTTRSGNTTSLAIDENDVIWGGASNTGNIYRYDTKTKNLETFMNLIPDYTSINIEYADGHLYAGGNYAAEGEKPSSLLKINTETKEITHIDGPSGMTLKSPSQIRRGGDYIFVKDGSTSYIYNYKTGQWADQTFYYKTVTISPEYEGKLYFSNDRNFCSIDVKTLEIEEYKGLSWTSHYRGGGIFFECEQLEGPCFLNTGFYGSVHINSPQENKMHQLDVSLTGTAAEHRISVVDQNDIVYITTYRGSWGVAFDLKTLQQSTFECSQGEGMLVYGDTVYAGCYTGATMFEYTVNEDRTINSKRLFDLSAEEYGRQDRPFDMDVAGDQLLIASLPATGRVGGALTIMDRNTYEFDVYYNIIPDQALLTVTVKDHIAYCGTTVTGGSNSQTKEDTAHIFKFDIEKRQIIQDKEFIVPGIGRLSGVHGLKIGPNGDLYGSTNGLDFIMDADTLEFKHVRVHGPTLYIPKGTRSAQDWHTYEMEFDEETGYLFRQNEILHPETLEVVSKAPVPGRFAGFTSDRKAVIFVDGTTGVYKVPIMRKEEIIIVEELEEDIEVHNGDFELPLDEYGNIPGWSIIESDGDVSISRVLKPLGHEGPIVEGDYCLLMVDSGGAPHYIRVASNPIPVEPGKTYTMSMDALIKMRVLWGMWFYDKDMKELSSVSANTQSPKDYWDRITLSGVAPVGAAYLRVGPFSTPVWATHSPGSHFDNFRLTTMSSYSVSKPVFTNDQDELVSKLEAGQLLRTQTNFYNDLSEERSGALITVLYASDDSILDVAIEKGKIDPKSSLSMTTEIILPEDMTGCYVKTFVWDDLLTMKPLISYSDLSDVEN